MMKPISLLSNFDYNLEAIRGLNDRDPTTDNALVSKPLWWIWPTGGWIVVLVFLRIH